jgi:hypothetical protein
MGVMGGAGEGRRSTFCGTWFDALEERRDSVGFVYVGGGSSFPDMMLEMDMGSAFRLGV